MRQDRCECEFVIFVDPSFPPYMTGYDDTVLRARERTLKPTSCNKIRKGNVRICRVQIHETHGLSTYKYIVGPTLPSPRCHMLPHARLPHARLPHLPHPYQRSCSGSGARLYSRKSLLRLVPNGLGIGDKGGAAVKQKLYEGLQVPTRLQKLQI